MALHQWLSESPGLVKPGGLGLLLRVSDVAGLGWVCESVFSLTFPGEAEAAGVRAAL